MTCEFCGGRAAIGVKRHDKPSCWPCVRVGQGRDDDDDEAPGEPLSPDERQENEDERTLRRGADIGPRHER